MDITRDRHQKMIPISQHHYIKDLVKEHGLEDSTATIPCRGPRDLTPLKPEDELTDIRGVNIVTTKWVFKIKLLPNSQIGKYKVRIVGRGFTQEYSVDYFETFAPVVRVESLRILLVVFALEDYKADQMDVVSAYPVSEPDEEVYIESPKGD